MSEVIESKFYVLRAISGKENKVREQIEAEVKINDLGRYVSRVIIPTEKRVIQRGSKKVVKEYPSMPGYVLVEARLVGDTEHRLRTMSNVLGFLTGKDGKPEPLSPQDVESILRRADDEAESPGVYDLDVYVGDIVRITDGSFADSEAVVEEVIPEKRKLRVSIRMFGRKMPMELTYAQVVKL